MLFIQTSHRQQLTAGNKKGTFDRNYQKSLSAGCTFNISNQFLKDLEVIVSSIQHLKIAIVT
jgi:hypothetical protein